MDIHTLISNSCYIVYLKSFETFFYFDSLKLKLLDNKAVYKIQLRIIYLHLLIKEGKVDVFKNVSALQLFGIHVLILLTKLFHNTFYAFSKWQQICQQYKEINFFLKSDN